MAGRGQVDEAIAHYRKALEIKPDYAEAHNNLGIALAGRGQVDEAIAHYRKALEIKPDDVEAHYNLGIALAGRGQVDEAIAHFRKALEIKPDFAEAHNNLGIALAGRGQIDEAIAHYRKALEIKPDYVECPQQPRQSRWPAADRSRRLSPITGRPWKSSPTMPWPTLTLAMRWSAADRSMRPSPITRRLWKSSLTTRQPAYNLGIALAGRGRVVEAIAHFQKALDLATARSDKAPADVIEPESGYSSQPLLSATGRNRGNRVASAPFGRTAKKRHKPLFCKGLWSGG